MAYIALKPIRFDRFYAVGEIIPEKAVDPAMAKKHIIWGSIGKVEDSLLAFSDTNETDGEEQPADNTDGKDKPPAGDTYSAGGVSARKTNKK